MPSRSSPTRGPQTRIGEDATAYADWFESGLGRRVWAEEGRALRSLLGSLDGKRVLDAGCGDGRLAIELTLEGAQVTGIERSWPMLALAASRAAEADQHFRLVRGSLETLPFDSESFDVIVAVTVFCFLHDSDGAVRELARVLRPGGRLVIGELGRWSVWAIWRRLRGWLGSPIWRGARFWTSKDLTAVLGAAGLRPMARASAVFFPPSAMLARLSRPIEEWLRHGTTLGAAFVAMRADKPPSDPEAKDGPDRRRERGTRGAKTCEKEP